MSALYLTLALGFSLDCPLAGVSFLFAESGENGSPERPTSTPEGKNDLLEASDGLLGARAVLAALGSLLGFRGSRLPGRDLFFAFWDY